MKSKSALDIYEKTKEGGRKFEKGKNYNKASLLLCFISTPAVTNLSLPGVGFFASDLSPFWGWEKTSSSNNALSRHRKAADQGDII